MDEHQTVNIRDEGDVTLARMEVRNLARTLGMDPADQARISLAASASVRALGWRGAHERQMTIECVYAEGRKGLRVVCSRPDSDQSQLAQQSLNEAKWMVDELTVKQLATNVMQITLIKWVA